MALAIAFAALGGLLVGSFLNVVVYRLPRGESLTHPRSRCPQLRHPAARDRQHPGRLVARAARPLPPLRRPGLGALSARRARRPALLYVAVVATQDDAVRIVLGLLLVTALVPITLIDLDHRIIPNRITGPAAIAAVVAIAALDIDFLPRRSSAAVAGGGFFFIAALLYPRGMGMGDVKLAGVLGLYLGRAVAPAIFIALVAGVAGRRRGHRAQGRGRRGARPPCPSARSSPSAA